jgi:hypothetical protein
VGTRGQISDLVKKVVYLVVVHREHVQILLKKTALRTLLLKEHPGDHETNHIISLEFAARVCRRGREVRPVVSPTETVPAYQSQALLKAIARAYDWREQLIGSNASCDSPRPAG